MFHGPVALSRSSHSPHTRQEQISASSKAASTAAMRSIRIRTTLGGSCLASRFTINSCFEQPLRLDFLPTVCFPAGPRAAMGSAKGGACKAESGLSHYVSVISQTRPAPPRATASGPGAFAVPPSRCRGRSLQRKRGPLQPPRPCLLQSSSSKSCRSLALRRRQASQAVCGLLVLAHRRRRQTVCAGQIVVASRYPLASHKAYVDHPAHVSQFLEGTTRCRSVEEQQ